ncbi:RICIN domain-containing protein [Streptomyces sp. L2]|uniref:ricin-type beta-trefoil lectin domain protein n=1 Tax=Streptomyces sp. L2 TaxID=2162665 RepID=UPI001F511A30|nr:RICIN domain-containing protein [Streptomyces sp. L2]
MSDVLRLGGPSMASTAQNGLDQPADMLHALADRDNWAKTPLATAYQADRDAADKEMAGLSALRDGWQKPLAGLETPAGFTETGFHSPPDGDKSFYNQTGLSAWVADRFWQSDEDFYQDETPRAGTSTLTAVDALGTPLYGKDPAPDGKTTAEWNRALAEHNAFEWMHGGPGTKAGADDARLFLSSGGFPHVAPAPGTPEYRIAVEDVKSRFAACGWRDPLDPDGVLGNVTATAAEEWQKEVASQATQRDEVLDANKDAVGALAKGAKALSTMLGHSWVADHLTRWQDYWSPGGLGWVGDSPAVIQVVAARGKCLDVQGSGKTNGTPVQIYTCNDTSAQRWQVFGDDGGYALRNINAQKCLDVKSSDDANGTKIQIWTCNGSAAQRWNFDAHAASELRNAATDKCLDLNSFANGKDSWLWSCDNSDGQKFRLVPKGHQGADTLSYPSKAQFSKAKKGVTDARTGAKAQLAVLKAQLTAAQKAGTTSDQAMQAAYDIADANGAPRGRGLLVGQQKAQVTKGAVAALAAMVKAGETAEAATRASAADSQTVAERALAQAAQSKAEFRKEAAKTAESQAKAAADAAKVHRDNAKKDKETAESKLTVAVKAEGDAKAAAADAHARRLDAEAEEKTAKAAKETAAAKQAEAATDKTTALSEATKAKDAKDKAEAAEKTAGSKRDDAVKAAGDARDKRDDAWDAKQKANAARAKADAKDAYADSLDSGDAADAARTAANDADQHADDAETAATKAQSAADAATKAAADADAAATRAEAAAKRARSDADAAQADKLKADADVKTATSAAADAIKASQDASSQAKTAVKLANEAEGHAKDAKTQADQADQEAGNAVAAAAKAVGYAHVTAQAAVDAGTSAQQVAAPANDAVQLGSPYITTDSAAGLVVLTGQASKTIAEQQQAVADAHAKNATAEADAAKNLADQAKGDAKEAYQHAANAARYAADALTYSKDALTYAADAATAASKAAAALARTITYDQQATDDADAADKAAGKAEGYAKDARDSADTAELDASAARTAAAQAQQDAKDARSAADRADTAATEAEQAAKDANKYAKEAQDAADKAEKEKANQQVQTGAATGVGGVFSVIDEIKQDGDPERLPNECHNFNCNTLVFIAHFDAVVSYYLCLNPDVPATESGCPAENTVFLKTVTVKGLSKKVKVSALDVTFDVWKGIAKSIEGDFTGCYHKVTGDGDGSLSDCAWAATWLPLGGPLGKITEAIRSVDAAMRSGKGVEDALKALKALDVDAKTLADIEHQAEVYEEARTACSVNSFPGTTQVVLANGSRKTLRDVRIGDLLLAIDPATGRAQGEPVTRTFHHTTVDLVDIVLTGGGHLTSTPGHRFYVTDHGWTLASDLRRGDALPGPDGTVRTVAALYDRHEAAPRTVYDLTVSELHTFYAVAGSSPVLVHNCDNLALDETQFRDAHTLAEHVRPNEQEAKALAARKTRESGRPTANSVWLDEATAQKVLDFALEKNASRISTWMRRQGGSVELKLSGTFGSEGTSLGKVYWGDRPTVDAGNGFFLKLVKAPRRDGMPKHPRGYYVQTFYPK